MIDFDTCRRKPSGSIRTPKVRLAYVHLERPNPMAEIKSGNNKGKFKYTVSLLIPPGADISMLREEASKVAAEKHGAEKVRSWVQIGKFNTPFLDAFDKSRTEKNPAGDERLKGWTLIRVDSVEKPGVVEANGKNIGDDYSGVYAGRWAFATLNPAAYEAIDGGKPGVKFYLSNIQLLDHDDRLGGGRAAAEDEFEPVATGGGDGTTDAVFGGGLL